MGKDAGEALKPLPCSAADQADLTQAAESKRCLAVDAALLLILLQSSKCIGVRHHGCGSQHLEVWQHPDRTFLPLPACRFGRFKTASTRGLDC